MATKKKGQIVDVGSVLGQGETGSELVGAVLSLDEILGQDAAIDILRRGIAADRLHHAWIFHGPHGVGKFTAAVAFAAFLLDPSIEPDLSGRLVPDPESQVQRLIRAGSHPDLHIITKELAAVSREPDVRGRKQTVIPKAVIQEFLIEPAVRTRVLTGASRVGKVFIVDEAELLDARTQNSLLKIMEEPPLGSVIILVTSNEDRLLTTIRSRCQRVRFGKLADAAMTTWFKSAGVQLDDARRAWLLRFASGAPGMARLALDHDLFRWNDALSPLLAQLGGADGRFPLELGGTMHQLVEDQAAAWVKGNPDASKEAANKAWSRRLLSYLSEHFRHRLLEAAERNPAAIAHATHAIDAVSSAEEELNANVNMGFVFENLAAKLGADHAYA